jgi:hypothetical protein
MSCIGIDKTTTIGRYTLGASTTHKWWSTAFYFEIIENTPFLKRKFQKKKFCASF